MFFACEQPSSRTRVHMCVCVCVPILISQFAILLYNLLISYYWLWLKHLNMAGLQDGWSEEVWHSLVSQYGGSKSEVITSRVSREVELMIWPRYVYRLTFSRGLPPMKNWQSHMTLYKARRLFVATTSNLDLSALSTISISEANKSQKASNRRIAVGVGVCLCLPSLVMLRKYWHYCFR